MKIVFYLNILNRKDFKFEYVSGLAFEKKIGLRYL